MGLSFWWLSWLSFQLWNYEFSLCLLLALQYYLGGIEANPMGWINFNSIFCNLSAAPLKFGLEKKFFPSRFLPSIPSGTLTLQMLAPVLFSVTNILLFKLSTFSPCNSSSKLPPNAFRLPNLYLSFLLNFERLSYVSLKLMSTRSKQANSGRAEWYCNEWDLSRRLQSMLQGLGHMAPSVPRPSSLTSLAADCWWPRQRPCPEVPLSWKQLPHSMLHCLPRGSSLVGPGTKLGPLSFDLAQLGRPVTTPTSILFN